MILYRSLINVYPYIPSLKNFKHYLQDQCSSPETFKKYELLVRFMNRYTRLTAGGILLPSLIEFYQWIITDLSHVITKKKASEMSLHDAVDLATKKYSEELEQHYTKLFENVTGIIILRQINNVTFIRKL